MLNLETFSSRHSALKREIGGLNKEEEGKLGMLLKGLGGIMFSSSHNFRSF